MNSAFLADSRRTRRTLQARATLKSEFILMGHTMKSTDIVINIEFSLNNVSFAQVIILLQFFGAASVTIFAVGKYETFIRISYVSQLK